MIGPYLILSELFYFLQCHFLLQFIDHINLVLKLQWWACLIVIITFAEYVGGRGSLHVGTMNILDIALFFCVLSALNYNSVFFLIFSSETHTCLLALTGNKTLFLSNFRHIWGWIHISKLHTPHCVWTCLAEEGFLQHLCLIRWSLKLRDERGRRDKLQYYTILPKVQYMDTVNFKMNNIQLIATNRKSFWKMWMP